MRGRGGDPPLIHTWKEQNPSVIRTLCGASESLTRCVEPTDEPPTCMVCLGGPIVYRLISTVNLSDGEAQHLSFIIESNGRSWRLYYQHGEAKSPMAWYPSLAGAEEDRDEKVAEAVAMGWTQCLSVGVSHG